MLLGFVNGKLTENMQWLVGSPTQGEIPVTDGFLDKAKGLFGG